MFPPICRISTAVAVLSAAVLVGLACSSSGLKTIAEAGVAGGGQAGSTISSSGTNGGLGGTIGSGGAGGTSTGGTGGIIGSGGSNGSGATAGSSGTGGTGGQGPMCPSYSMCNPSDQQVTTDCPAERECYTPYGISDLPYNCQSVLCVLPAGRHCSDPLQCSPGDFLVPPGDQTCVEFYGACYYEQLCGQSILCKMYEFPFGVLTVLPDSGVDAFAPDAGVDAEMVDGETD